MPMSFRTSAENYRNLLWQIKSIDSVVKEIRRLKSWRVEQDSSALGVNYSRERLSEALEILKDVKCSYEDTERLCRPLEGFTEANSDCVDRVGRQIYEDNRDETYRRIKGELRRNFDRDLAAIKEVIYSL